MSKREAFVVVLSRPVYGGGGGGGGLRIQLRIEIR